MRLQLDKPRFGQRLLRGNSSTETRKQEAQSGGTEPVHGMVTIAAMHMARPNEHHERLANALAGTWKGTETMHPSDWDPNGSKAPATATWNRALGNFVVIVDYCIHNQGQPDYQGHGVYTIDPENNDVLCHWFDNIAGQHELFRGSWTGDVLTMQSKSPMGYMQLRYDLSEPGKLKSSGKMSSDGENWKPMFDGLHARQ